MIQYIKNRYHGEGGYRIVLKTAFPLILSTASWAVMHFVDRIFLTWHSTDAVAAAMPAGILNFTVVCLFIGTAGYVNTFVAQYYGAKKLHRVGPALWQGIYMSCIGALLVLLFIPFSETIFTLVGHSPKIQVLEATYFKYLCLAGLPVIGNAALTGFFSGMGRTWPIMWVNFTATGVNIILDYLFIFGKGGFPEMGIKGAAIASVLAACSGAFIYSVLIFRMKYEKQFKVRSGRGFNMELFKRLIRYGLPNGLQFFIDVSGFALFVLMVGRLGDIPLAASNIAFNINTIAFMPMIGVGITCTILTGQHLGENRPEKARRAVFSGFHIAMTYMCTIAALYVLTPTLFTMPYAAKADPESFAKIEAMTVVLLRFVAIYSVFDSLNLVFAGALKGAGDTRFIMKMILVCSLGILVIPSYVAIFVFKKGLFTAWIFVTAFVVILGFTFLFRFLKGKWKTMRVIEDRPTTVLSKVTEVPPGDF